MTGLLGVMVPMAFPGPGNSGVTLRGEAPADYLLPHLERLVAEGFGAAEVTRVLDPDLRREVGARLDGLDVTYAAPVVQLQNVEGLHPYDLSHPDEPERRRAVDRLVVCVHEAVELGARRMSLMSGRDPVTSGVVTPSGARADREAMREATRRSLLEVASVAAGVGIELGLVSFDRCANADPVPDAFKAALIGPTLEAVSLVDEVRRAGGVNVGLALDTAHLTQNGEGAEEVLAAVLSQVLSTVHVSNCVLDPGDPDAPVRYGDRHPRFGCPGSAIGPAELVRFAAVLTPAGLEVGAGMATSPVLGGYQGPITFEVKPVLDEDPWEVLLDARQIWSEAVEAAARELSAPGDGADRS